MLDRTLRAAFFGLCLALSGVTLHGVTQSGVANADEIEDRSERLVGAVEVLGHEVRLVLAMLSDSAILHLSVDGADGKAGYAPIYASTFRGIPDGTIELAYEAATNSVWVRSKWPGGETLGYHVLGSDSATGWVGTKALGPTAFPEFISGGAPAFPDFDPEHTRILASFYLSEDGP